MRRALTPILDTVFDAPARQCSWTMELRLISDLFPIKRYPQFDDSKGGGVSGTIMRRPPMEHFR